MGYLPAIIGGLTLGLFMAISVGPTLFAVIRYSLNHSYKSGLAFIIGVSASDIMYVTLANLATPFLQFLHRYEKAMGYGGGALLVVVGLAGFLKKYKPKRPSNNVPTLSQGHYLRIGLSGFLINTINPGVVINWLAAVTIIATHGAWYRIIFFGTCLLLVLGIDVLKVVLADKIRRRLTLRLIMYLQKTSALVLLGFGLVLIAITFFGVTISPEGA